MPATETRQGLTHGPAAEATYRELVHRPERLPDKPMRRAVEQPRTKDGGLWTPNEAEWGKIQDCFLEDPAVTEGVVTFAREDFVVAQPWAANTLVDRSFGRFHPDALRSLATSSAKKSVIVSHDWRQLGTALIFDHELISVDGSLWFRPKYYLLLDDEIRYFVRRLQAGIIRHVSVGFWPPLVVDVWRTDPDGPEEFLYEEYRNDDERGIMTELAELSYVFLGAQYGSEHRRKAAWAPGADGLKAAALQHAATLHAEFLSVVEAAGLTELAGSLQETTADEPDHTRGPAAKGRQQRRAKETEPAGKAEEHTCECIACGHTLKTSEHCDTIKCPQCGGTMRRQDRPGPGKESAEGAEGTAATVRAPTTDELTAMMQQWLQANGTQEEVLAAVPPAMARAWRELTMATAQARAVSLELGDALVSAGESADNLDAALGTAAAAIKPAAAMAAAVANQDTYRAYWDEAQAKQAHVIQPDDPEAPRKLAAQIASAGRMLLGLGADHTLGRRFDVQLLAELDNLRQRWAALRDAPSADTQGEPTATVATDRDLVARVRRALLGQGGATIPAALPTASPAAEVTGMAAAQEALARLAEKMRAADSATTEAATT